MQIARVVGTVVSTQKHRKFEGAKLLLVQPLNLDESPLGPTFLAVDGVGAGVDEKVLIVLEGRAAGEALGKKGAPVDAAIVGIIDQVSIDVFPELVEFGIIVHGIIRKKVCHHQECIHAFSLCPPIFSIENDGDAIIAFEIITLIIKATD